MRTGKPTQHYLSLENINIIKRKTKDLKRKNKSNFVNAIFQLIGDADLPLADAPKKRAVKEFLAQLADYS